MRFKINKFLSAGILACMVMGSLLFNGCSSNEPASTVTLTAFGPSAALRGGNVKFIGTNLDKVTAIDLPGTAEITTFVSKTSTEIVITIPQDTKPGLIILKTPQGDITTKTPLTFTEPISIASYTTTGLKAGEVFTINGDYLNLIAQVIFSDGAVVDSSKFISQTRKIITLYVPKAAKTGKVALSNGASIPVLVYTAGNATILDPTTFTTLAPNPVKPGSILTLTGTYMNLIKSVILPDGNKIDSAAISVIGTGNTQISVKVPLTAKQGKVKIVTYSGTTFTSVDSLKLVGPSITAVSPMLVKNGSILTVTGTNLDLVTGSTFTGGLVGIISNQTTTGLQLTVPLGATDGTVILSTNSGLTATSSPITLVKPTFTSISPLSLTAGDSVTIAGTDLDLVRTVKFSGGSVNVTPTAGTTSMIVGVPATCAGTGSVTFETVNGTEVKSSDQLVIIAATTPAISTITAHVAPGGLMTITGKNLNNVESIYFPDNVKAVLYGVRSESSLEVYVPMTATHGITTFTLNSFDGKQIVSPTFIYGTEPVQDPNYILYDFDNWGIGWNSYGTAVTGPLAINNKYYYVDEAALPNAWYTLFSTNWGQYNVAGITKSNGVVKMDINILDVDPTLHLKFRIDNGWYTWNIGTDYPGRTSNGWVTVTFPLSGFDSGLTDADLATSVANGAHVETDLTAGWIDGGGTAKLKMAVDNVRFEKTTGPSSVFGLY